MLACLMQDLMRLIWPCSSVEDLKQMSGWCEEINNTRCLEEFAHLFGHPSYADNVQYYYQKRATERK